MGDRKFKQSGLSFDPEKIVFMKAENSIDLYQIGVDVINQAIQLDQKGQFTSTGEGESDIRGYLNDAHQQMGFMTTPFTPVDVLKRIDYALVQAGANILRLILLVRERINR